MEEYTGTDLIFFGKKARGFPFIKELLVSSKNDYFNCPEGEKYKEYLEIIEIFNREFYIDFALTLENFPIFDRSIHNAFANVIVDGDNIELLFFFSLSDIDNNLKNAIDYIKDWVHVFKHNNHFDSYICQIDNGNENEFYFNSDGFGPAYYGL